MYDEIATARVYLSDAITIRAVLHLAQARYRSRLLSLEQLLHATAEAECVLKSLGLTAIERVGVRIEVSASEGSRALRGVPLASFAEAERTRLGWRLNRVGRRINRPSQSAWLATALPSADTLARAATRILHCGMDGRGRL